MCKEFFKLEPKLFFHEPDPIKKSDRLRNTGQIPVDIKSIQFNAILHEFLWTRNNIFFQSDGVIPLVHAIWHNFTWTNNIIIFFFSV